MATARGRKRPMSIGTAILLFSERRSAVWSLSSGCADSFVPRLGFAGMLIPRGCASLRAGSIFWVLRRVWLCIHHTSPIRYQNFQRQTYHCFASHGPHVLRDPRVSRNFVGHFRSPLSIAQIMDLALSSAAGWGFYALFIASCFWRVPAHSVVPTFCTGPASIFLCRYRLCRCR